MEDHATPARAESAVATGLCDLIVGSEPTTKPKRVWPQSPERLTIGGIESSGKICTRLWCGNGIIAHAEREPDLPYRKTTIERIFREIFKREMTPKERQVLLPKPKKTRKPN